jgi:hypothetical protein
MLLGDMAKKSQIEKFRAAARAAGTDESEQRFDETLKGLAKTPRKSAPARKQADDSQASEKASKR